MLETFSEISGFNQRGSGIVFGKCHGFEWNLKNIKEYKKLNMQDWGQCSQGMGKEKDAHQQDHHTI